MLKCEESADRELSEKVLLVAHSNCRDRKFEKDIYRIRNRSIDGTV